MKDTLLSQIRTFLEDFGDNEIGWQNPEKLRRQVQNTNKSKIWQNTITRD